MASSTVFPFLGIKMLSFVLSHYLMMGESQTHSSMWFNWCFDVFVDADDIKEMTGKFQIGLVKLVG